MDVYYKVMINYLGFWRYPVFRQSRIDAEVYKGSCPVLVSCTRKTSFHRVSLLYAIVYIQFNCTVLSPKRICVVFITVLFFTKKCTYTYTHYIRT